MVETASGGSGGGLPQRGASPAPTARPRRGVAGGSTQTLLYGQVDVKVYPINEDQLSLLRQNRGWAGLCFTIAGVLFGFGMNTWLGIDLSSGVSEVVLARWQTIQWMCLGLAVFFVLAGCVFLRLGHSVISKLKNRTSFAR
jgi:hypothetical protein